MNYEFVVPCNFGVETFLAYELRRMKMNNVRSEDGRVFFSGSELDMARANVRVATGERVLILVGETEANSFDMLFEGVKAMLWEQYIPMDGAFPVRGSSINSQLHSIPDCQSIIKKAIVERMKSKYKVNWFRESGAVYQVRFNIYKDKARLYIDTSGTGLHKRGYRLMGSTAPLRETLAAAMVSAARYKGRETFRDPFCGSGTIAIEAALAAKNRAPGINRQFAACSWTNIDKTIWDTARQEARDMEFNGSYDILGTDIDPDCIEIARANARRAGVENIVRFETADARQFDTEGGGIIVTNPPYGERIMERRDAERLYRQFGQAVRHSEGWKMYILSSHTEFERSFGRSADKKRKLYNGLIKCDIFMYL